MVWFKESMAERARGCLLGQFAGDSLGSLVEFQKAGWIARGYPGGVRDLADGGTFNNVAGQLTDDSEMALALARTVARLGRYDVAAVRAVYVDWMESGPFDIGGTTSAGLSGRPRQESQANGALMRCSPLGIFGAAAGPEAAGELAAIDAAITHPNPLCVQANRLYVMAIADAIANGTEPRALYDQVVEWAQRLDVDEALLQALQAASVTRPVADHQNQGWVLIAFQNAFWQLLHAPGLEDGVVDTVMLGGDTDTNACICGALLGSVHGAGAVPERWVSTLLSCRPEAGRPGVVHPRPRIYWPCDVLEVADALLAAGVSAKTPNL